MILDKFCTPEWKEFVLFHSKIITLKRKEIVFQTSEETRGIFLILEGKVKVTKQSGAGGERIIRLATNDDFIGHRGFGGNWKYTVTAHCLTPVEALFIPMNVFETLVKGSPEFAYFIVMFFAEELRISENLATTLPMKNQIAAGVLKNYQAFGFDKDEKNRLSFTLSRKDLASMVGTRYETVVRALSEFRNEGIIELDGKNISLLDLEKLKAYVC